jgi:hypothetical protein
MKTRGAWALVSITWVFIFSHIAWAQIVVQHQQPTVFNTNEKNHLEFFIPGVNPLDIDEALLFYKNEGDFSYSQIEIPFINGVFKIDLNSDMLTGTSFEYYFKLSLGSQSMDIFYPDTNPLDNPLKVDVIAPETALDSEIERNRLNEIDYTIISPERGSALSADDAFIAIALYYDIDSIPSGKFRLYLNDKDVTNASDTNKYFISYTPRGLDQGIYQIRLDYSTDKEVFNIADWNFRIVQPEKVSTQSLVPKFKPTGQIELTGRNQVLAGDMNNAYTGRSNLSGSFRKFKYNFNGFLTSQEDPRLQPQNRYSVRMNLGKWWNFEAGHIFPQLSKFTIAGRRIYGINTSVHLLWENINVQFLYGELSRKITNRYTSINEEFVYLDSTQTTIVDTTYTLGLEDRGRGTFKRNIVGGRVALGNPRFFQLGLQALKVEDDTSSIFNVVDYSNIFEGPTSLINGVSMAGQQRLFNSPELLRVQGGGVRPKGNIVAGIDLKFAFDKNRIRFHTETVASALNNDIYGGPLTSERAEELGFEDVDQSELDILRDLTKFIIINENINVLPLRVTGIGTDSTNTEFFFPTGILGSNTEFSLIYPKNTLKLQYRWVGPDFVSLANSTIRKDISGFTFLDRFRVFKNQVYITLGYEYLSDNVTNTKEATTVTSSLRSNLSWYPVNQNLPRISMGLRVRDRDNGVRRFNPFVPKELQSAALQNLVINNDGDTLVTSTPRSNETINYNLSITQQLEINGSVHDATFSLNNLNTSDEVFAFGDIINKSYSFNISSRYSSKSLRTQLGVSINQTKSGSGQLKIDIFGIYTGATYFLFNGALKINGRVAYTSNVSDSRKLEIVTEGDDSLRNDYYILSPTKETSAFNTYVLLAGLQYRMTKNQSINFDSNFTSVSGGNGLNDRLIQLRYIYRF